MYRDRVIEDAIKEVANSFPSVVIYGSRQVGKSTTVNHIFGNKIRRKQLKTSVYWRSTNCRYVQV